jgi:uncharacterized protein (TIGR03435 family)
LTLLPRRYLKAAVSLVASVHAQVPTASGVAEFDVVSIKRSSPDAQGGGARRLPDGTDIITNQPIRIIFGRGGTEPTRDVEGLPSWAMDRYDITVKPPSGTSRQQLAEMWRAMLADRLKLESHVERRERAGFAMVLARADGRLGPNLKRSALDCAPKPGAPPPSRPVSLPTAAEAAGRCGALFGQGYIVSGGTALDALFPTFESMLGGPLSNRTGLTGFYAFELRFAPRPLGSPTADPAAVDDPPDLFTAVQEQLGLKFQREKITIPVLIIDHVERPTEN